MEKITHSVTTIITGFSTAELVALFFSLAGAVFIGIYILRRIRQK